MSFLHLMLSFFSLGLKTLRTEMNVAFLTEQLDFFFTGCRILNFELIPFLSLENVLLVQN